MFTTKSEKLGYQTPPNKLDQKPKAPQSSKKYCDDIGTRDIGTVGTSGKFRTYALTARLEI